MQTESGLKSKLEAHFTQDRRRQFERDLQWLKSIQSQGSNIYIQNQKYFLKYDNNDNYRLFSCSYLRDTTSLLLTNFYYICCSKAQIRRAGRTRSLKVSDKLSPRFQGSYVWDQRRNTYYKLEATLRRGGCEERPNKVKMAINVDTQEVVAIKIIQGSSNDLECGILKLLDRYKGDLLVPSMKYGLVNQYIIQSFVPGKSLMEIVIRGEFDSKQIDEIIQQCFEKLRQCHELGIIVNDLNLDHILYDATTRQLEFIDFGHSELIIKNSSRDISMLFHNGQITKRITLDDEAQLIERKNKDVIFLHAELERVFCNILSTEQTRKLNELKERHLTLLSSRPTPLNFEDASPFPMPGNLVTRRPNNR